MKQSKKALATMLACGLVGAMAIGGTFAYLTDEEEATNTFTVGKVTIDLTEPDWDPDHPPVVPNEEVDKDPTITNTGNNSAYAFVEVKIPMKNVIVAGADGTRGTETFQELFTWGKTDGGTTTWCTAKEVGNVNGVHDNWTLIKKTADATGDATTGIGYTTYTFAYNKAIPAGTSESQAVGLTLFDKVKFANVIEGAVEGDVNIPIKAYAIQSDAIDKDTIGTATGDDMLRKIYDIYAKQNEGQNVRDAANGDLNLKGENN